MYSCIYTATGYFPSIIQQSYCIKYCILKFIEILVFSCFHYNNAFIIHFDFPCTNVLFNYLFLSPLFTVWQIVFIVTSNDLFLWLKLVLILKKLKRDSLCKMYFSPTYINFSLMAWLHVLCTPCYSKLYKCTLYSVH